MKKMLALLLALVMVLSLAACASSQPAAASTETAETTETTEPAAEESAEAPAESGKTYTVGVCQLVQHEALDAATQGFIDALKEELGDAVTVDVQNASGDSVNCGTIVNGFVSKGVDLIMANATPALTAAVSATADIPILGTSITAYGVALDIDDFNGTVGGNGAGKSTMLNAIAGSFQIDSGKIVIDGTDVTGLPEHKRAAFLGRVFQDPMMGTAPTMQIEENLALAARRGQHRGLRWGITKAERAEYQKRLHALDLGLEDRMTAKVGLLSGGQRQALTLLMAALQQPKLLLLDEHTAALDPRTAAKVLDLSDLIVQEHGLTTLMITHNMKDAIAHGNRLIMMDAGQVVVDVSGEEKKKLTVPDLLAMFSRASGSDEANDKMLLS